uniref:Ribosomal L18p/L5e family protein n=1 Tax=Davidia involucrata TaxID=16924 RepID=A0A5B7C0R3_DAVIN
MTTSMLLRRVTTLTSVVNPHHFASMVCSFTSRAPKGLDNTNEASQSLSVNTANHLSPLFTHGGTHLESYKIELVDMETWRVSSGLVEAWRGKDGALDTKASFMEGVDEVGDYSPCNEDPDFDEIEDMRIRGNLFYKLDRDSKEFEEYNFDFHRKKSSKNKDDQEESTRKENSNSKLASGIEKSLKNKEERKKKEKPGYERLPKLITLDEMDSGKKVRTPTFNQLTAPYHEPFCLDIYISKGSVRACIVHRATSNVVVVAHSISKDMKFDLASTKNASACAAVGQVLAQRALADDIHNAVYTPRKGDKLEGKLQIVLQSIIDNGVTVKVKLKQRKVKKGHSSTT